MHRGIAWDKVKNPNPQSTPQVLSSFEKNTPPLTYPDEVEEIIGIPIEVEPLDETPLEDLGSNTSNHDIPLSSRKNPSFDEPEPQPQPFPTFPFLEVDLGEEIDHEPPIKAPSLDSFRMKEVDHLTIHTPPLPHMASFHPKDTYCYYHPCIDDPKKHYGFKPGLLGQSGSLGVDFSNMEMIEDDWQLKPKEVSFLGEGLNLPVRPKELENDGEEFTKTLQSIPTSRKLFERESPREIINLDHFYDTPRTCDFENFFKENEKKIFSEAGDGIRIYLDGVVIFDEKKLGSS
ncbi:hypothetical protein Tco_0713500 [Tanacetum coccineum]